MGRLFGLVSNITLATATATTGPPYGTGAVQIGMGGRLKAVTLLSVTTGVAPCRGCINLLSTIANSLVGVVLVSGTFRGPGSITGGDIAEQGGLHWVGDYPISDKNPTWLYFAFRNDTGATLTATYGWVQEYER